MFLFKVLERVKEDFPIGFLQFKNHITAKKDRNIVFMDGILEGLKYFDILDLIEFFVSYNIFPTIIPSIDKWICIIANKKRYKYKASGFRHESIGNDAFKSWESAAKHLTFKCFEMLEDDCKNNKKYADLIKKKIKY